MKLKDKILALCSFVLIVLEILPYGVICYFMEDEAEEIKKLFSYFSLTPFGYANFYPFIVAILSLIIVILCIIILFKNSNKTRLTVSIISALSAIISLYPVVLGTRYFSILGIIITLCLVIIFVLSLKSYLSIKKG